MQNKSLWSSRKMSSFLLHYITLCWSVSITVIVTRFLSRLETLPVWSVISRTQLWACTSQIFPFQIICAMTCNSREGFSYWSLIRSSIGQIQSHNKLLIMSKWVAAQLKISLPASPASLWWEVVCIGQSVALRSRSQPGQPPTPASAWMNEN